MAAFAEGTYPPIYSRVVDSDGFKATVRYVGPVAGAKNKSETWVGVEWDDAGRGKHDGSSVDIDSGTVVRHFTCAPGQGSFIKPNKLHRGCCFLEALAERYVGLDAPTVSTADATLPDAFITTLKGNQKTIEFVGEEKIRKRQQIDNVKAVALRGDSISRIGEDVQSVVGHLEEIDLQGNLLWEWREISLLGAQVPHLHTLLLHSNRMQPLTDAVLNSLPSPRCFANLRVLVLNSCGISAWADVQRLEPLLPSVEELFLAHNAFPDLPRQRAEREYESATGCRSTTADFIASGFQRLRLLDLTNCGLDEWSQVAAFRALPALQELVLDQNAQLSHILPPRPAPAATAGEAAAGASAAVAAAAVAAADFPVLQRFSLSGTGLARWFEVDQLAKFPQLQKLRLSQIPLFDGRGSSEVRPQVISRIPQLRFFNGSQITHRERVEAEKSYLRDIMSEASQDLQIEISTAAEEAALHFSATTAAGARESAAPAAAAANAADGAAAAAPAAAADGAPDGACGAVRTVPLHPRFAALMEKYGADLVPASKESSAAPHNLAAELVTVTFRNLSFGANGSLEPLQKKLPRSLTIARLRLLVKQLFGLEPRMQDLSLRAVKDGSVPVLLDDDKSNLMYYGVMEGAEIFVNDAKG